MPLQFPHDVILAKEDICNLEKEKNVLKFGATSGKKILLYGRRNTGKTSIVESVVIPHFKANGKDRFVLYADLLGVESTAEISRRLARSFGRGFLEAFPTKSKLKHAVELIKGIRPQIGVDPLGNWSVSISGSTANEHEPTLEKIFEEIKNLESAGISVLVVLDEFQDIYFAKGANSLLRNELQHLSKNTAIILLGSKKHLLAKLFTAHKAPFFNWGEPVEIGPISYDEYFKYMKERFLTKGLKLDFQTSKLIQDLMKRIPEPINILCSRLLELLNNGDQIDDRAVYHGLREVLRVREGMMNEYLTHFTRGDLDVMVAFAKSKEPVQHPAGKEFLKKVTLSKAGAAKTIAKLIDEAVLYEDHGHFELADPILEHFLRAYR